MTCQKRSGLWHGIAGRTPTRFRVSVACRCSGPRIKSRTGPHACKLLSALTESPPPMKRSKTVSAVKPSAEAGGLDRTRCNTEERSLERRAPNHK